MGPLTALVLATPIFGLSLTPPMPYALSLAAPLGQMEFTLEEVEAANGEKSKDDDDEEEAGEGGEVAAESEGVTDAPADEVEPEEVSESAPVLDKATYRAQLRKRGKLAKIHRTLGITTWALTGLAVIAGTIQWRNMYAGKTAGETPCGQNTAWLGQEQCWGTPMFHALTGFGAGAAYVGTLGLAIAMPDPDNASVGDSQYAKNVRTHKILRWVHLTGMVAQAVLGVMIANPKLSGDLDRANDYGKLRALSLVHLTTGLITFGALSWAGTIMLI